MMMNIKNTKEQNQFWAQRYKEANTGWDIGYPSTPIKSYIDQLTNKEIKILIPGAGNAYEAEYLFNNGFEKVFVLDIANPPLEALKERVPNFPAEQMILGNFFEHTGQYDLILEQTFFCSFLPTAANRQLYAQQMEALLKPKGKLVGLWFTFPLTEDLSKPPYGGAKEEYLSYLSPYFEASTFEACYNSIPPRMGNELFGVFQRK